MANITAQLIATLITANCEKHFAGDRTRDEWSAEQYRLWRLAERRRCAKRVKSILYPQVGR